MYIYLGGDTAIRSKNIVGIFDLDNTTVSKKTRVFLSNAEKTGCVEYTSYDLPKTYLITQDKKDKKSRKTKTYITSIAVATIKKRIETLE